MITTALTLCLNLSVDDLHELGYIRPPPRLSFTHVRRTSSQYRRAHNFGRPAAKHGHRNCLNNNGIFASYSDRNDCTLNSRCIKFTLSLLQFQTGFCWLRWSVPLFCVLLESVLSVLLSIDCKYLFCCCYNFCFILLIFSFSFFYPCS